MKLWVPPDSKFVRDSDWLMSKFQIGFRPNVIQIVANDVLTPEVFQNVGKSSLFQQSLLVQTSLIKEIYKLNKFF